MGGACSKGSAVKDPDNAPYGRAPTKSKKSKAAADQEPSPAIEQPAESQDVSPAKEPPVPTPRKGPTTPIGPATDTEDRPPTPPPIFDDSQRLNKSPIKEEKTPVFPDRETKSETLKSDVEPETTPPKVNLEDVKVEFQPDKIETTRTSAKFEMQTQEIKSGGFASVKTEGQDVESLLKSLKERGLTATVTTSKSVLAKKTLIVDDGQGAPVVSEKQVASHEITKDGEVVSSEVTEAESSTPEHKLRVSIPEVETKFKGLSPKEEKSVVTKSAINTESTVNVSNGTTSPVKARTPEKDEKVKFEAAPSPKSPLASPVKIEQRVLTVDTEENTKELGSPIEAEVLIVNGNEKSELETRERNAVSVSSYASIDSEDTQEIIESIIQKNLKSTVQSLLLDFSWANSIIQRRHRYTANTRTKLQGCLEKWIIGEEKEPKSSFRVVWGQPGMGKTCLSTDICKRHASRIAAVHFFDFCTFNIDHNNMCGVILSLAHQMCGFFPNYHNTLPKPEELEQLVGERSMRELWQALIVDPLNSPSLDHNGRTSLIVLDSLEECNLQDKAMFYELLNEFHGNTPSWIQLLATTSDDNQIKSQLESAYSVELKNTQDNLVDIKRYLKEPLSPFMDRISLDGGLTQLAKKSEGNFLCAYLFAKNLEAFPKDKKIALREIDTLFPTGLQATYSEVLQGFFDYLVDNSSEPQAQHVYECSLGMLLSIQEPIHKDFLNEISDMDADVVLEGLKPIIVVNAQDCVHLHHVYVRDWLWNEKKAQKLAVDDTAGRQKLQEGCMKWLQLNGKRTAKVHPLLRQYALKHAITHLIDVPRQQDSIAKLLCSLQYIHGKISLEHVNIHHLYNDYQHEHYQTLRESPRKVTLSEYMKRQPKLMEQIESYHRFVLQKGPEISQSPEFTINIAANYPNVQRIQQNAKLELEDVPWIEDCTVSSETPCVTKSFQGVICGADVSPDNRQIAVVVKDENYSLELFLLGAANCDQKLDTIDVKNLKDRVGLCVKYLKDSGNLFLGSLTTLINNKGKCIPSGFDLSSIQLKEKFSIESCDSSNRHLACGVSTFPWGGRSLHMLIFDMKTKKCVKSIEVLKFRFGGSAQFGIRSCALSSNSTMLCTCVKQTNKDQVKVTIWSMGNYNQLHSIDLDGDSFTKSAFLENHSILCGGSIHCVSKNLATKPKLWKFTENKVVSLSDADTCFGISSGNALSSSMLIPKGPACIKQIEDEGTQYRILGLDNVKDMMIYDKYIVYLSFDEIRLYDTTNLEAAKSGPQNSVKNVNIESMRFLPKIDTLVLAHYKTFQKTEEISVSTLDPKQEDMPLAPTPLKNQPILHNRKPFGYFYGPGSSQYICSSTPDGNLIVLNNGTQVKVWNRNNKTTFSLPTYEELNSNTDCDDDGSNEITCAVSPKDPIVALLYSQDQNKVVIFDLRTKLSTHQFELKTREEGKPTVTDFAFLPVNGYLMTFHREAVNTLAVWNQRSGEQVHMVQCVHIAYLKASPASDRVAISIRRRQLEGELVLTNSDGRFNTILDMPETWLPGSHESDVCFSADGTIVMGVASQNNIYRVWNAGNGEVMQDLSLALNSPCSLTGMLTNTHAVLFDGRLVVVDIATGDVVSILPLSDTMMSGLQISPKGNYIVGATELGMAKIFLCHNFGAIRMKTTLQRMKSVTSITN
ncbi:hypothetical protein CAPTEDRAFT_204790 [Capitella teleta]|uniref:Nephrocystin 3-like N-terminal domain-containing protein n=1 Tax=Capitella teleta TaxID=283909 RepID=R7UYN6_CAPTE|nr:hypothetical protein CAPTEDRAFT_204790 [Capitella teleta]|eukprot:ELU08536.1 hypothetical protein CAPTEDRAFT_204790 [Capitella teleta]